jgi:alpha-beta hydrolase superfamily lysophospholipase
MQTYNDNPSWSQIAAYLPQPYQLSADDMPTEESWGWHGNDIHLDTYRNPTAPTKVILMHGVGTNGRQMTTILGHPLAKQGLEIISIDMPLYGMSQINQTAPITYTDWVQIGSDYVDSERQRDNRPIYLYGLSAGGMETYHVAALNGHVAGIIGMTFLDQRDHRVRLRTTRNKFWGHFGAGLAHMGNQMGLGRMQLRMATVSLMTALCNDPGAQRALMTDKTSAGAKVPVAFLDSYMHYQPAIEPDNFDVCPILLTQPGMDRWTPLELSTPFLAKVKRVPVRQVILPDGGHYPVEAPALAKLNAEVLQFITQ